MPKDEPKLVTDSEEETKLLHERYLLAVNSPVRRKILEALRESNLTVDQLCKKTNLEEQTLSWHLSILERALCVEKAANAENQIYRLTKAGKVIEYL